jgi:hypothetical protein
LILEGRSWKNPYDSYLSVFADFKIEPRKIFTHSGRPFSDEGLRHWLEQMAKVVAIRTADESLSDLDLAFSNHTSDLCIKDYNILTGSCVESACRSAAFPSMSSQTIPNELIW